MAKGESYSSFSWDIKDNKIAIKHCDKSFFEHHGTGIPMDTKDFWGVENLSIGERKDIKIIYNGTTYDAYLSITSLNRTRMFWYIKE